MLNKTATPPMGWNTWNAFRCQGLNQDVVLQAADSLVETGMRDAGYEYLVIDDCWQSPARSDGRLVADPKRFRDDIGYLAEQLHHRNLKLGMYLAAGKYSCAEIYDKYGSGVGLGSLNHLADDIAQLSDWGVEFIKWDWCKADKQGQNPQTAASQVSELISQSPNEIIFSISEYGKTKPWLWAQELATMWRTTGDLSPHWLHMMYVAHVNSKIAGYTRPGGYNDPDMLQVGNGNLIGPAGWTHLGLWAMFAAPLFAGNDLTKMSSETARILTDPDLIALDQDRLVKPGKLLNRGFGWLVLHRTLSDGAAILVVNLFPWSRSANLAPWYDLLATNTITTTFEGRSPASSSLRIPAHGSVLIRTATD